MADGTPASEGIDRDNAPAAIVILNRDLMFGVQIDNVVRSLGLAPHFVRTTPAFASALRQRNPEPALGILDMNGEIDWTEIAALVLEPDSPPLLAFGPHVDVDGRRAAKAAGVSRIVSNGEFHRSMPDLIARYARGAGWGRS